MAEVIAYAERRIRAAMEDLPAAEASFRDFIEGDGYSEDDIPIVVRVISGPGRLSFDFTGSSSQVRGPINATFPFTLACVAFCVKTILDPTTLANEGMFAPLQVVIPKGSILDATFPAAMSNNSSILGLRIVDAIFGALSQIFPRAVTAASSGTMNVVTIGGFDPRKNERFAYIESYGGGQGGSYGLDGMDGVHTTTSNTRNASAEVIERSYPITVTRYGLVEDSGGDGEYRGGLGLFREFEFHTDTTFSLVSDRKTRRPWGLFGGKDGAASCCTMMEPNDRKTQLSPKVTHSVPAGTRLYLATAGGGGYGNPSDRSAANRDRDRLSGIVR
jgi:N-methylhydantoinase B